MTDSQDWLQETDQLLRRVQQQDPAALEKLYRLLSSRLLALITRIVKSPTDAEEVLQESMVKVWQQANQYTGSGTAWGWVCILTRHCAIDRLRKMKKRTHESTDEMPELLDQLSQANDLSDNHWLGRCLETLKPQTRDAILLSSVKGYSHGELSEKLAVPLGTVKAWIRRGLQELKQCLTA